MESSGITPFVQRLSSLSPPKKVVQALGDLLLGACAVANRKKGNLFLGDGEGMFLPARVKIQRFGGEGLLLIGAVSKRPMGGL